MHMKQKRQQQHQKSMPINKNHQMNCLSVCRIFYCVFVCMFASLSSVRSRMFNHQRLQRRQIRQCFFAIVSLSLSVYPLAKHTHALFQCLFTILHACSSPRACVHLFKLLFHPFCIDVLGLSKSLFHHVCIARKGNRIHIVRPNEVNH